MLLVHGFAGTPATWTPLLPALEQHHDVLAPTLLGHSGGPGYLAGSPATPAAMADALERDMDSAGFDQAHLVGNSLGGWLALELAVRGRALSTTALAPAGGWTPRGPEARLTRADRVGHEGSHPALARIRRMVPEHDPPSAVDRARRTRPLPNARRRPAHRAHNPRAHPTSGRSARAVPSRIPARPALAERHRGEQ